MITTHKEDFCFLPLKGLPLFDQEARHYSLSPPVATISTLRCLPAPWLMPTLCSQHWTPLLVLIRLYPIIPLTLARRDPAGEVTAAPVWCVLCGLVVCTRVLCGLLFVVQRTVSSHVQGLSCKENMLHGVHNRCSLFLG